MQTNSLEDWRDFADVKRGGLGPLFPTESSVQWHTRIYRRELIEAGQFVPGTGRASAKCGPKFEQMLLDLKLREARATLPPKEPAAERRAKP